jgi:hypothetical protein
LDFVARALVLSDLDVQIRAPTELFERVIRVAERARSLAEPAPRGTH